MGSQDLVRVIRSFHQSKWLYFMLCELMTIFYFCKCQMTKKLALSLPYHAHLWSFRTVIILAKEWKIDKEWFIVGETLKQLGNKRILRGQLGLKFFFCYYLIWVSFSFCPTLLAKKKKKRDNFHVHSTPIMSDHNS